MELGIKGKHQLRVRDSDMELLNTLVCSRGGVRARLQHHVRLEGLYCTNRSTLDRYRQDHHVSKATEGENSIEPSSSRMMSKADQETQSPVLKIFTDMLAREKSFQGYRGIPLERHLRTSKSTEADKEALLRVDHKKDRESKRVKRRGDDRRKEDGKRDDSEKRTTKKNKKPKTGKKQSACELPSSEDIMQDKEETRAATTVALEGDCNDDNLYVKRERVRERTCKKKADDTCSCASCVLKKMCRNDCVCCSCVAFLFVLCLFLAFLMVCRSIPCMRSKMLMFGNDELESDRLKRKIDVPSDMQWDGLGSSQRRGSHKWDDGRLSDHAVPNAMDLSGLEDMDLSHRSEFSQIIDSDKLNEIQSNDRLREFYQKLVSTDEIIRKLKKDFLFNRDSYNSVSNPERAKRSLGVLKKPFRMFHSKKKKTKESTTEGKITKESAEAKATLAADVKKPIPKQDDRVTSNETKVVRNKRYDTNEHGLFVQKSLMSAQFEPNGPRTSKCSHAPKEINSYEKQVKNPFYQNTQRLDELLDKTLHKNIIEIMGKPRTDAMMAMKKCKHKHNEEKKGTPKKQIKTEQAEFVVDFNDAKNVLIQNSFRNTNNDINMKTLPEEDTLGLLDEKIAEKKLTDKHFKDLNIQTATDAFQEFLQSHVTELVTTDETDKESYFKKRNIETNNEKIHLLQVIFTTPCKDNDNSLPVKDTDDSDKGKYRTPFGRRLMQTEMDDEQEASVMPTSERDSERKKRRESNPNILINPNWKGPIPLYPDEMNMINKPGPFHQSRPEYPMTEQNVVSDQKYSMYNRFTKTNHEDPAYLTDTEYIEDYFSNKHDRIAELAQAYSDYGVLNDKNVENRVDNAKNNAKIVNSAKIKVKKSSKNLPSPAATKMQSGSFFDNVLKNVHKHIRLSAPSLEEKSLKPKNKLTTDTFETTPDKELDLENLPKNENPTNMDFEYSYIKKRSLKSMDYYQSDDPGDAIESLMNFRGIFEGLQKKFSTKLGSAQDYALRVASDYIHEGIYKRDIDSVDVDSVNDSITDGNKTERDSISGNYNITGNITEAVKLIANKTEKPAAETIETAVEIGTSVVHNDTGTSLSDFFMKLAHWFSLLDTLDISVEKSQQGNLSATKNITEKPKDQSKFEGSFPPYDAEMIEHIGHRSRVLLAVNETEAVEDSTPDGEGKAPGDAKDVGATTSLGFDEKEIVNTTTTNLETVKTEENITKNIVKRNADSNIIFWNDIDNEKYVNNGVNVEGSAAGKNVQASRPADKTHPRDWFKQIVTKFKKRTAKPGHEYKPGGLEGGLRKGETAKEGKAILKKRKPKNELKIRAARRFYRKADAENTLNEKKTDFTVLTAKMKKICQRAANDISLSKKLEVNNESKEGQVASRLMQQLVRLMSDLVDYQVHEKTCRKLPMDLQNFLEWLTDPESTITTYRAKPGPAQDSKEPLEEANAPPPADEEVDPNPDAETALAAVRDLMNRYEALSDDDKSKMSGVIEYLESQLEYLQKQVYANNDFNTYSTDLPRFKREAKVSTSAPRRNRAKDIYIAMKNYLKKQHKGGKNRTTSLNKNLHSTKKVGTRDKCVTVTIGEKTTTKATPVKTQS